MDEDEFCRWAVLRTAGVNMLPEFNSPVPKPLYRGLLGWNELREATAVMSRPGTGSALYLELESEDVRSLLLCLLPLLLLLAALPQSPLACPARAECE